MTNKKNYAFIDILIVAYVNAVLAIIIEYIFDLQILEIASICFKPFNST